MNCSEFQQRLEHAIESHGPAGVEHALLAQHPPTCGTDRCRQLWQQSERLARAVRCWQNQAFDIDLNERVLAQLQERERIDRIHDAVPHLEPQYAVVRDVPPDRTPPVSLRPVSQLWVPLATLAAALLLVLSVLTLSGPATRDIANISPLLPPGAPAAEPSFAPELAAGTGSAGRLAGSYAAMPLSATQFLTDAVVLVVPADLSDPEDEPSPADVWADRLGKRWEPIGRELSSALEALIEAVPRTESAS